jgi:hypothetical protein
MWTQIEALGIEATAPGFDTRYRQGNCTSKF